MEATDLKVDASPGAAATPSSPDAAAASSVAAVDAGAASAAADAAAAADAGPAVDSAAGAPSPRVVPPAATEKPKSHPGEEDRCQMVIGATFSGGAIRCPTKVASRTASSIAAILTGGVAGLMFSLPDAKHHCQHCLKRVCPAHFTVTEGGARLCTEVRVGEGGREVAGPACERRVLTRTDPLRAPAPILRRSAPLLAW